MKNSISVDTLTRPAQSTPGSVSGTREKQFRWLILATLLGVVLSLPTVVSIPLWPQIAPLVSVLLLLINAGLLLLTGWVYKFLLIPNENGAIPRQWLWQNAKTRRTYMRIAINMSAFLFFYGALSIVIEWVSRTRDLDSLRFGLGYMVAGVVTYIFFVLMWGRVGSPLDRALDRPIGVGFVFVLPFLLSIIMGFWLIPSQIGKLKVGPAALWAEQWSLAQKAIAKKYPDAVFTSLLVSRAYDAPATYDASLEEVFFFRQSDGSSIQVNLRDTNPQASIHVNDPSKADHEADPYTSDDLAKLKPLGPTIHIGPRDALLRALAALKKDNPGANTEPNTMEIMPLAWFYLKDPKRSRGETFNTLNKPAAWHVSFYLKPDIGEVSYWIDAQTGEILLHDRGNNP